MERYRPRVRLVLAGGPCFCVVFAFLAWPCTGSPKVPSGTETSRNQPHVPNVPVTSFPRKEKNSCSETNLPGFHLGLDEDFQMAGSFQELIHGYTAGLVEPYVMRGLQPLGSNRTILEVIIPSPEGLTPEK